MSNDDRSVTGDGSGRPLPEFDGTRERTDENVQPVGDDDMNDDQRRLAKQKERDAQQREVDKAGDAERARREREAGEPEGSRGRNADPATGETDKSDGETEKPAKASGRTTGTTRNTGK